jgi:hypothetical protein
LSSSAKDKAEQSEIDTLKLRLVSLEKELAKTSQVVI